MRLLFALPLLVPLAAGAAPPPWQQAEDEARTFLVPCKSPSPQIQQKCLQGQQSFIEQYVIAMSGDVVGVFATVGAFMPSEVTGHPKAPGMPEDPFQLCAWSKVVSLSASDPSVKYSAERLCDGLTSRQATDALARAAYLLDHMDPDNRPPDGWKPAVEGLKGFPRRR